MPILLEDKFEATLAKVKLLKPEIQKVIVGQDQAIDNMLICLLAGGHGLLEGVPGLAKTLMVKTMAEVLDLSFNRIQFTPDLMPADIIGYDMIEEDPQTGKRSFVFVRGPIFAACILADEINRTPPKTQAALLEAMQEKGITFGGKKYTLPSPFFLMATQNPIEQAGTYPLPEAQMDRFLLYIQMSYPTENEELNILKTTTGVQRKKVNSILNIDEIETLQHLVKQVHVDEALFQKMNLIVRNTRPKTSTIKAVNDHIEWGAGPRAGQALVTCAKARAILKGRYSVIPEDISALLEPVLNHRIKLNYTAEAEGITKSEIIKKLV
jgi:MoxR-like ATPase